MSEVWIIRAGRRGEQEQFALDNDCVVIGWSELPDLRGMSKKDIQSLSGAPMASSSVWQPYKFANEIQKNDLVMLPSKIDTSYTAIGEVVGDYEYHATAEDADTKHRRAVRWLDKELPKAKLPHDIKNSLYAMLTICVVRRDNAGERIRALLQGKRATRAELPQEEKEDETVDLRATADDFIKAHIREKFSGYEMQKLIAAILEAAGFRCLVPPKGADGGEIGAGKQNFCVQVKNTGGKIGDPELRDLRGTMQNVRADKGVFVSWGGFSNENKLRRDYFFEMLLWNSDDVLKLIYKHYENLSDDIKNKLRLEKIWTIKPPADD